MKWKTLLLTTVALAALATTPAYAVDYSIDGPSAGNYGTPTSDSTIYETVLLVPGIYKRPSGKG